MGVPLLDMLFQCVPVGPTLRARERAEVRVGSFTLAEGRAAVYDVIRLRHGWLARLSRWVKEPGLT